MLLVLDQLVPGDDVELATETFRDDIPVKVLAAFLRDPDNALDGLALREQLVNGNGASLGDQGIKFGGTKNAGCFVWVLVVRDQDRREVIECPSYEPLADSLA